MLSKTKLQAGNVMAKVTLSSGWSELIWMEHKWSCVALDNVFLCLLFTNL